jgi:TetR/AcrR family transcriptional repressor of lmrAB and yxaGH operons
MPRVTDTRPRMIRSAARLLRRQGYAATGWRQVVADSETPWGSQAHHFPGGKEQLATEALADAGARYARRLRAGLADLHPAEAVAAWADAAAHELEASGWADGCPIATVALETAATSEALAHTCAAALASWRTALVEAMVRCGLPASEAPGLATLVLAAIEGALLLARAERDPEPLHLVGAELGLVLRARIP